MRTFGTRRPSSRLPAGAAGQTSSPANSVKLIPLPGDEKRITLHIDDLDVRKALEMLSRQTSMSMAISPGVSGRVTLDMRDKTVGEALETIAKLCHLTIRRDRNMTYISTLADLRQSEEDELPIRVYHLNYVRSTDLEAMIRPLLSDKGTMTTSPDSEQGIATNSNKAGGNLMAGGEIVIVQDYEQSLRTVDRVVAQIDVQPVQVLIEAVIVQSDAEQGHGVGRELRAVGRGGKGLDRLRRRLGAQRGGRVHAGLGVGGRGQSGRWRGERLRGARPGAEVRLCRQQHDGLPPALETLGETKVLACPRLLVAQQAAGGNPTGPAGSAIKRSARTRPARPNRCNSSTWARFCGCGRLFHPTA